MGAAIEKNNLQTAGQDYLQDNKEKLAYDTLMILNGVKKKIGSMLQIDMDSIDTTESASSSTTTSPQSNDNNSSYKDKDDAIKITLAIEMLNSMTETSFHKFRLSLLSAFQLAWYVIPTAYMLKKSRPKIISKMVTPWSKLGSTDGTDVDEDAVDATSKIASFAGQDDISMVDAMKEVDSCKEKVLKVARLVGGFGDWLGLMFNKHKEENLEVGDDVIIISSADGANHNTNPKRPVSIISFNSILISPKLVSQGVSTAQSHNILTYQQMEGVENRENLFPVVTDIYEQQRKIREEGHPSIPKGSKITMYEVHDGKMLYLLSQHSLWNRSWHQMLRCKCRRGDSIKDPNHVCQMIDHAEEVRLFDRSKRRFDRQMKKDDGYNVEKHKNWLDEHNYGVSHFGLHPEMFRRDSNIFDVLNLRCLITQR